MKRFKNILLVHECDTPTLERAATLAKSNRAKLTIVHAVHDLPPERRRLVAGGRTIDIDRIVREELRERLREAAASARAFGVRPAVRLLAGEPFVEIVRDVQEHGHDLVIMTAEGRGGLRERLFGSTSTHLMRKCPVPLLVVKPGRRKRFQRVLAAVDPSGRDPERSELDDLILQLAGSLAEREGAQLHVAHAWTLFGESLLRGRGGLSSAQLESALLAEAQSRYRAVHGLLARHGLTTSDVHLPKGEAAELVPTLVRRLDADLLVMGTVCRTGIPGFFIGNTAERVLDQVDCSVLVVKPRGFVSPIAKRTRGAART